MVTPLTGLATLDMPPGAANVPTASFALAQTLAQTAVDTGQVAGFFGEPGTGKTHALRVFEAKGTCELLWITASTSPQRKEVFEEILLAAGRQPDNVSVRQLRRDCQDLLAEKPRALVIDECQNLSLMWHQQLRGLHDHPSAKFALLLVGGANVVRTLTRDPQLWSRIRMRVYFEQLRGEALFQTLTAYHPVLANTDRDLLRAIDEKDCGGYFRNWYHVLDLALPLLANQKPSDRLTPKVMRAVFTMRGLT